MRRRLRVLTWNVGRLYSPTHNNRLDDADVPRVAHVLHELDPDVALLQEIVDTRQLAELVTRLSRTRAPYDGAMTERCVYDRRAAVLVLRELPPRFEEHGLGPTGRTAMTASFAAADG